MELFTNNLRVWNRDVFGNIFKRKRRLLGIIEGINRKLIDQHNERLANLRQDLWKEYTSILSQEEAY